MLVLGIRKNFMKEVAFAVGSESGKAFGRQLKVEENINLSKVLGVRDFCLTGSGHCILKIFKK